MFTVSACYTAHGEQVEVKEKVDNNVIAALKIPQKWFHKL